MQFLYFLPNVFRDSIKPDDIVAAGLNETLRDRMSQTDLSGNGRLAVASVDNGPGGHNGTILQVLPEEADEPDENAAPATAPGYYPAKHTWEQVGKYWVGYDPNDLPGPHELERERTIAGRQVVLGDARTWGVPTIRLKAGKYRLPDTWKLVNGQFTAVIKPDWKWAWELTGEIWDWHSGTVTKTPAELFAWCVKLLAINYRIGPFEAGLLGLVGTEEFESILFCSIGGMLREAYEQQKKSVTPLTETGTSSAAG